MKITGNLSSLERYEKLLQNYYQILAFISELLSRAVSVSFVSCSADNNNNNDKNCCHLGIGFVI